MRKEGIPMVPGRATGRVTYVNLPLVRKKGEETHPSAKRSYGLQHIFELLMVQK